MPSGATLAKGRIPGRLPHLGLFPQTEITDLFLGILVPIKTIRYYEDIGLLNKPVRTPSGYRLYDCKCVDRLVFIKKAQSLGLRLNEIKEILDLADRGHCPCGHVQKFLKARLKELRQKITDLREVEGRIESAVRKGCPPSFKPRGKAVCPVIDKSSIRKRRVK